MPTFEHFEIIQQPMKLVSKHISEFNAKKYGKTTVRITVKQDGNKS